MNISATGLWIRISMVISFPLYQNPDILDQCHNIKTMVCLGRHRDILEWSARQKIALGAARGLRYLHEECRVGCIVHRDMRPNNILITHDFEPLVWNILHFYLVMVFCLI